MTDTDKEQEALRAEFENIHKKEFGFTPYSEESNPQSEVYYRFMKAGAAYGRKAALEEAVKILEEAAEESYQLWIKSERADQLSRGESIGIQNCMEAIEKLKGGV